MIICRVLLSNTSGTDSWGVVVAFFVDNNFAWHVVDVCSHQASDATALFVAVSVDRRTVSPFEKVAVFLKKRIHIHAKMRNHYQLQEKIVNG